MLCNTLWTICNKYSAPPSAKKTAAAAVDADDNNDNSVLMIFVSLHPSVMRHQAMNVDSTNTDRVAAAACVNALLRFIATDHGDCIGLCNDRLQ